MKARTVGTVQGVMFLMVLPLSFASNVFVRATTMPGWLQAFANVNPLSHYPHEAIVAGLRGYPIYGAAVRYAL